MLWPCFCPLLEVAIGPVQVHSVVDQSSVRMGRALPGSPALPRAGQRHKRNALVNAQGHFISCGGVSLIESDFWSGEFLLDHLRCVFSPTTLCSLWELDFI